MKIIDIPLGAEGDLNITLSAGVLSLVASENTAGLQGGVQLNVPIPYFIDALVAKLGSTPTEVAIASLLKSVLIGLA